MGPKKKKGGKKASGEKKKKEAGGEVLTFKEAVLIYQLEVKQSQINIVKEDFEDLKLRNEKQKQRNLFLKNEQNRHMKDVIEQARQHEKESSKKEEIPYEHVEKALIEKKEAIKLEKEKISTIQEEIMKLDNEIEEEGKLLHELKSYKEHGQYTDETQICLLKKEMEDMKKSYAEMSEFFEKSLATIKATITKENEDNVIRHKKDASEKAIENLDEKLEQEFIDNKWLLRELAINKEHIALVSKQIESLQVENMDLISNLFDNQLADVSETRKFYLTCQKEMNSDDDSTPIFALDDAHKSINQNELGWLPNDFDSDEGCVNNSANDSFKLDPVEMKLLCVVGTKAVIHETIETEASEKHNYRKFLVEPEEVLRVCNLDESSLE